MSYILPEAQTSVLQFFISWPSLFTFTIALAFAVHKLLVHLDYPILSAFELLWNAFVYLMPAQAIHAIDSRFGRAFARTSDSDESTSSKHAGKSEVLRNVFGLDGTKPSNHGVKVSPGPRGLGNWDNSCFQNSVLQALSSLSDFRSFLEHFSAEDGKLEDSSLLALLDLTRNLNDRSESCKHMWTPAKLKSMNSWQQQDAQEYFSKIMDQLENDVKALWNEDPAPSDPGLTHLPVLSKNNTSDIGHKPPQIPLLAARTIDNPVDGLLAQRVGCLQCGYADGISLIPFNCLTLPLGKQPSYDIRDCLDSYTDLELIDGVECGKCTLIRAAKQLQHLLSTLPDLSTPSENKLNDDTKRAAYTSRLEAVTNALESSSFGDATLTKACQIPAKLRITSTKTRQAVVMRQPKCLVLHVNRSMFDEYTGDLLKNHASVSYAARLDLGEWSCGSGSASRNNNIVETSQPCSGLGEGNREETRQATEHEQWQMDPAKSMLVTPTNTPTETQPTPTQSPYCLQALITHQGRHENGHYICYRKLPRNSTPKHESTSSDEQEQWWRLSDEQVWEVSEEEVLAQQGVFMLFYERIRMQQGQKSASINKKDLDAEMEDGSRGSGDECEGQVEGDAVADDGAEPAIAGGHEDDGPV